MPNPDHKSVSDESPESESSKTFRPRVPPKLRPPTRPTIKSGATPAQRPKPAKPSQKIKTELDPLQIGSTTSDGIQNSQTDMPPASGLVKQIAEVTHSPGDTELKTITLGPKTSNRLETEPFPHLTMSPNSRITSELRPQTAGQVPSIPMTTRPNKIMRGIFPGVIPSASPGSTKPKQASKTDSRLQAHTVEETAPSQTPEPDIMVIPVPSPRTQTTSTTSPDLRSTTPATSGPEPLAAEASTPSARELRVKINQVAAFFNNSLSPKERPLDRRPKEHPEDNQGGSRPNRTDGKLPSKGKRDYFNTIHTRLL
ncbi:hypothetical protein GBF38_020373 [Nibea albiflora]|uniref:Uncharacterized protein n=1 Tax=Nibea albiflora TaxID=240163 RepID=A0ACB7FFC1_NIBAL|nr:hypothetical protein GBF38_020373 [Nibea albiflora]